MTTTPEKRPFPPSVDDVRRHALRYPAGRQMGRWLLYPVAAGRPFFVEMGIQGGSIYVDYAVAARSGTDRIDVFVEQYPVDECEPVTATYRPVVEFEAIQHVLRRVGQEGDLWYQFSFTESLARMVTACALGMGISEDDLRQQLHDQPKSEPRLLTASEWAEKERGE